MNRFAPTALMLGNVVTGCSVLAPAGMLSELSSGLDVSIRTAGLLITFGAIMLCVGSPVTAWLTSRIERRNLLTATLAVLALANFASAFAPDYTSLLIIRLVMLAIGALYTPQAAGTAGLIVPEQKRGSTIAYIFLGWSLAAAVGLPLITFIASRYGWRAVYGSIGLMGCVSFLLLAWRLPRGLMGAPVDLKTWADIGRNRMIGLLLLITTLQMSGQFVVFTFMGPLLARLTGAGPDAIGLVFAVYGVCGVIGTATATRIVNSWGAWKTSVLFTTLLLAGVAGWALSAGHLFADGRVRRDLGPRFCVDQFDAAGAAGRRGAFARIRLGVAQHLGALYRAGGGIGDRRLSICARTLLRRRLRRLGLRRAGGGDGDPDEASSREGNVSGEEALTGLRWARWRGGSRRAWPPS